MAPLAPSQLVAPHRVCAKVWMAVCVRVCASRGKHTRAPVSTRRPLDLGIWGNVEPLWRFSVCHFSGLPERWGWKVEAYTGGCLLRGSAVIRGRALRVLEVVSATTGSRSRAAARAELPSARARELALPALLVLEPGLLASRLCK